MNKCLFVPLLLILLAGYGRVFAAENSKQDLHPVKPYPASDFALKDDSGKLHKLSRYKGKLVVLNFWATWCPPCREEMPAMERAWQKLQGHNIVFLAINVGETEEQIFPFTASYPVSFPLLMDIKGETIKRYPVAGLPTTFIIDPRGRVISRAIGTREWEHPAIINYLIKHAKPSSNN